MKPIEIDEDCQFLKDAKTNNQMAMYNLITSKSAVKLWTKGIKPNRHWRITDVKNYFGMNGNAETLLEKLKVLHKLIKEDDNHKSSNKNKISR